MVATADIQRTLDAVWRMESARIIAGRAEELAQDALVAALEHWPKDCIPDNPGAWLMATAKNRALDALRQRKLRDARLQETGQDLQTLGALVTPDFVDNLDDDIGDDLLRLICTACHPVLPTEARTALTLRVLGGLSTGEIARAFLVPWRSVLCVPSAPWPRRAYRLRCRARTSCKRGWPRCWR